MFEAVAELEHAFRELLSLGFDERNRRLRPADKQLAHVKGLCEGLIRAAEELLLLHKPLATSMDAYGFLHSNELLEHWDRYGVNRLPFEINQLLDDTHTLLNGYRQSIDRNEDFLVGDLRLPPPLGQDFRTARDLFSVGLDDAGLLIAGRGLEGVVRSVARKRKIQIQRKNEKMTALAGARFIEVIDGMAQLCWKQSGHRVMGPETTALLHFLRNIRNGGAHPVAETRKLATSSLDTARLVGQTATHLWEEIGCSRRILKSATVQLSSRGDLD